MILKNLTGIVLRRYLMRLPLDRRLLRYRWLLSVGWLKSSLIQIKPEVIPEEPTLTELTSDICPELIQVPSSYYRQYRCIQGDPLSCQMGCGDDRSEPGGMNCEQCYFPAWLKLEQQLNSSQGQYTITQRLGRRGIGRLYTGIRLDTEDVITIREYLLPERYFNGEERQRYQKQFLHLTGLALADGRSQDMRVVTPLEAIADPSGERCFIVTSAIDCTPTLNQYCARHGAFNDQMVRDLLNQALQTLIFLHQQIFTLPTGRVKQGVIHGNIDLNSLLWKANDGHCSPQGFLYFTDFNLWENIFDPTVVDRDDLDAQDDLMPQDDLAALGKVAFWVLNGATLDHDHHPLNPRNDSDWPSTTHRSLQQFIRHLMGIEAPFKSADVARLALLKLPSEPIISQWEERPEEVTPVKKSWFRKAFPILGVAIIIAVLGGVGWWVLMRSRQQALQAKPLSPPCCFKKGGVIPTGTYTYTIPTSAYWHPLFATPPDSNEPSSAPSGELKPSINTATNITTSTATNTAASTIPNSSGLFNQIEALQAELSLVHQPTDSVGEAIAAVQSGQADFAILPLLQPLPPDVTATTIAYDGLVPVVAFSYFKRAEGLPHALDGRIRLQHLQALYTSNTDNWQLLHTVQLPLERYLPEARLSQELINSLFFEQSAVALASASSVDTSIQVSQTLQTSQTQSETSQTQSEAFTSRSTPLQSTGKPLLAHHPLAPNTTLLPTLTMLRQILQDFENDGVGGIGIAPLSQVFGQCSVYPLAVAHHRQFVSPLIFDDGKPITPESDLCDRKGIYSPHGEVMRTQTYPLAYPLAIVYPFDNTRSDVGKLLGELLLTQEGQRHLAAFGMVPAYSLP